MRQTIQIELEDKPGALMRVAGILSATGSNIESLILKPAPLAEGTSSMIIVVDIEPRLRTRVVQQMNRLINVLSAEDITETSRECAHHVVEAAEAVQ
jgi:acetolactate synthase I/III small subunit